MPVTHSTFTGRKKKFRSIRTVRAMKAALVPILDGDPRKGVPELVLRDPEDAGDPLDLHGAEEEVQEHQDRKGDESGPRSSDERPPLPLLLYIPGEEESGERAHGPDEKYGR